MDYARLQDLLDELERGNRYHICVVFFGSQGKDCLRLRFESSIHTTPACNALKIKLCFRCRAMVLQKARTTNSPFGGHCIRGIYEYCHPVYRDNKPFCVILVGNILRDRKIFLRRSGRSLDDPLLNTMEQDMDDGSCARIACLVESYIHALMELSPQNARSEQNNAVVAAMQADVDRNFCRDISLTDMAHIYHYNEKYLGRLFKTHMGISFGQYLNLRRLEFSAQLLRRTKQSVLDISQRVGFNNVTYFNRLFRQQFGMSPSQYRSNKKG